MQNKQRWGGLFIFLLGALLYVFQVDLEKKWIFFFVFFLLPDLFALGYLVSNRVGVRMYNFAHSFLTPITLLACSGLWGSRLIEALSIIWITHLGFDRLLGFGLKYPVSLNKKMIHRLK